MDNRIAKLKLNSIIGFVYQIIVIGSGLLLPKFFLKYYGSDVYGLVSSITQFLAFINICDMGIGAVVSSALYKPLAENDYSRINTIFATTRKFFRIISLILILYIAILAIVFPVNFADDFENGIWFTASLVLAMGISQFGQFFLGVSYQLLLNSDQRYYVQLIINSITLIANTIGCVVLMIFGFNIQIVKLFTSIIFLLRPILLMLYARRKYPFLKPTKSDWNSIPQKANGIIQHISYTIYENTDVVVLTTLSTLFNVAIYTVYNLVVSSIRTLIVALTGSSVATFGNMLARGEIEETRKLYDSFEWFLHTISSFLFVTTGLLIVDFVLVYTSGIDDCNYNVPLFAVLITISSFFNCIRVGMFNIIKAAGHYKRTQFATLIEAIINIVVSVVLVFSLGLIGVAIGTLCATLFFSVYEVVYLSKNIIERPLSKFLKQFAVDLIFIIISIASVFWVRIKVDNFLDWTLKGIVYSSIIFVVLLLIEILFYRKNILSLFRRLIKRDKNI